MDDKDDPQHACFPDHLVGGAVCAIGVYHHNKMEFYEGTFAGSIFIAGRRMACYTPF